MEKLKLLLKNEKKIAEGFVVSIVGGWALSSIVRGTFTSITDIGDVAKSNFIVVALLLLIGAIAMGLVYHVSDKYARITMFILVTAYLILCSYTSYSVEWLTKGNNSAGREFNIVTLCVIALIAFLYVKKDIFEEIDKIKLTKIQTKIIIAILGVAVFAFIGSITVFRYITYSNTTFDFGIFAQMYEYMKQKGIPSTTCERGYLLSHFGVHFSPIYYLGLPIYFIFSSPITVQLIQAIMIALPVIPLYLLSKHFKLSNLMSIGVILIYSLYPATMAGAFYDIHENCFLTFFILMFTWAVEEKKNIVMIICGICTLLVKEDAFIYILILGAYYLFSRKDKKRGIIMMIIAIVYFAIATTIVNSFGLGILEDRFANLMVDTNGGLGQVIQTIITNPGYVISQITKNSTADGMDKIKYLLVMLLPMAGTLMTMGKKYSRYILLLPFLVINVFTTYTYLHDITFQYDFGVIALFMYLFIMNISEQKQNRKRTMLSVSLVCVLIMFVGIIFPVFPHYVERYNTNKTTYQELDKALATIPSDASVSTSGYLLPHTPKNLQLYDQRHLKDDKDVYTDYLVVDLRSTEYPEQFATIIQSGQYETVYKKEGIIQIYKKK